MFKRTLLAVALFAAPAVAQQQPYVPFTIDETDYRQIMTYLGDQPAKIANPLINKLAEKEQAAVAADAEARSKAAKEKENRP